tara:strand:+ start:661 stop:2187 length:1527 start_codon:yes stop_codon:yes gene_type:complete
MAIVPGYLRQIGLPQTTKERGLPSVQINDYIGQAVSKGSDLISSIGSQITQIQADSDVSQAKVNATLKLNQLETQMSTVEGSPAAIDEMFQTEQTKIFQEAGSHITDKRAQKIFSDNFNVLSAQSQVKIKSAGIKRAFSKAEADLEMALEAYALNQTRSTPGTRATSITVETAIRMGTTDIENAIKSGVISADVGAKRAIKFTKRLADNAVVGWLNNPMTGTTRTKLKEMESGVFKDRDIQTYWRLYGSDERKKASLISQAITNIQRKLTFDKKAKTEATNKLQSSARILQLEFYRSVTTSERRGKILEELSKNTETSPSAFDAMTQDFYNLTPRFNDRDTESALMVRIMRNPSEVTTEQIITSGLSTVNSLLKMHSAKIDERTARSKRILLSEPAFIPTNSRDKRSDVLGVAQAGIWTIILEEQSAANDKGEAYDPIKRTQELIKEFKIKAPDRVGESVDFLETLGIVKKEDVDLYITEKMGSSDPLSTSEVNKIRTAGRIAFGNSR